MLPSQTRHLMCQSQAGVLPCKSKRPSPLPLFLHMRWRAERSIWPAAGYRLPEKRLLAYSTSSILVHELISESFEYKSIRIRQKHLKEEEPFACSVLSFLLNSLSLSLLITFLHESILSLLEPQKHIDMKWMTLLSLYERTLLETTFVAIDLSSAWSSL